MTRPPRPDAVTRPWLQVYPPGVPPTFPIPQVPLPRLLDDAVRDFPEQVALRDADGVELTHRALRDRVGEVVAVLGGLAVGRGDRVLLATGNTLTTPIVLLALWRLAAVPVPASRLRSKDGQPTLAVADARAAEVVGMFGPRATLRELFRGGLEVGWQLETDDEGWFASSSRWRPRLPRRRRDHPEEPPRTLAERVRLVAGQPVTGAADGPPAPGAPAWLLHRERRGVSRGIVLTHANLVAASFQARLWVPDIQAGRERVLVGGDLTALGPLVLGWLAGLLAASSVELAPGGDGATLARTIERRRPTVAVLEPAAVTALLADDDRAKRDLSSLRVVLAAGAPLDVDVARELERRTGGARVREGFCVSEAGPLTHAQPVYGRTTPGAMGLPVTESVAVVVDPDDLSVVKGPGQPGLLLLAGPQVAGGYWQDPAASAERFVDGWVVTDDLAEIDGDGVFTHLGHRDEVLPRGGSYVSPRRIEAVLERHPAVSRAGVTTDPETGMLIAGVRCRRWHQPSPQELIAYGQAHLDSRAAPEQVILVDEFPETDTGELARDALRQLLTRR
ncbi:MAG: AMP-binding protein [Nitriliruptoraceae bacterium]